MRVTKDKTKVYNEKYEQIRSLGDGQYAEVIACKYIGDPTLNTKTHIIDSLLASTKPSLTVGDFFAIKKFKNHTSEEQGGMSIDSIREIKFLQKLQHPNIIKVVELFLVTKQSEHQKHHHHHHHHGHHQSSTLPNLMMTRGTSVEEKVSTLMMVMPLCLPFEQLMGYTAQEFGEDEFRWIFKQILEGMDYLHSNYILHRDIKITNLLVDKNRRVLITDFGLSREISTTERYLTSGVFTPNYRPPEIILGSTVYGPKSDMWAIGVVMAEILMRFESLFPINQHDDEDMLLRKIFALRGTPTQESWKDYDKFPKQITFTPFEGVPMSKIDKFREYSAELIGIIEKLLTINPNNRPTARELLDLPYFKNTVQETKKYEVLINSLLDKQKQSLLQVNK